MKEKDYIKATNRAKISTAMSILRDVLTGHEYGVDPSDFARVKVRLSIIEERLFSLCDIEE